MLELVEDARLAPVLVNEQDALGGALLPAAGRFFVIPHTTPRVFRRCEWCRQAVVEQLVLLGISLQTTGFWGGLLSFLWHSMGNVTPTGPRQHLNRPGLCVDSRQRVPNKVWHHPSEHQPPSEKRTRFRPARKKHQAGGSMTHKSFTNSGQTDDRKRPKQYTPSPYNRTRKRRKAILDTCRHRRPGHTCAPRSPPPGRQAPESSSRTRHPPPSPAQSGTGNEWAGS